MAKITEIINYEGDNSTFVWKHPCEDFNSLTQLIVHESQEAVFFMNGQALDLFGPGRYTLETQNLPALGKMLKNSTGGVTPFHCEVYYINKTVQMGLKWGTPELVHFIEPTLGVPIGIGASGEMNLMVSDSRKLLVKLVGTMNGIAWGDNGTGFTKSLQSSFRPLIATAVKTHLASSIKAQNINLLEIDENLEALSAVLRARILPGLEEYGLTVPQFYITNVNLPEGDPNFKRLRELHTLSLQTKMVEAEATVRTAQAEAQASITAAQRKVAMEEQTTETEIAKRAAERELIEAQTKAQAAKMAGYAEAEIMQAKGYTQKDVFQTEIQKAYAEGIGNIGANGGGGVVSDFVSLGVGMAAAGQVGAQMGDMFKGFGAPNAPAAASGATCAKCGSTLPANAKFCMDCGARVEIPSADELICPVCGEKTVKGKFCMACGAPLMRKCKCGADIPSGAKFCLECGEKL
ncbi:MAG: SPFH domain-containing protein [Clostridia bacterium]|nr:SPFH domain-containing protein [Clostridia bacterium]